LRGGFHTWAPALSTGSVFTYRVLSRFMAPATARRLDFQEQNSSSLENLMTLRVSFDIEREEETDIVSYGTYNLLELIKSDLHIHLSVYNVLITG
jgi:hypothetical protein